MSYKCGECRTDEEERLIFGISDEEGTEAEWVSDAAQVPETREETLQRHAAHNAARCILRLAKKARGS